MTQFYKQSLITIFFSLFFFLNIYVIPAALAASNTRPVVSAGPDQTITFPNGTILTGSATDDGLPNPPNKLTYTWSKSNGPSVSIANKTSLTTTVTFTQPGVYTFKFNTNDSKLSGSDYVQVTVIKQACGNGIKEGTEQCDDGNTSSGDGCSSSCVKEYCGDSIVQALLNEECDHGSLNGTMDDTCLASCKYMSARVENISPSVNAGSDQTITLPMNQINLNGVVTDDGNPNPPGKVTISWSQVNGPTAVTFSNNQSVNTTATFSKAGIYVLRLKADDSQLWYTDDVTITVNEHSAVCGDGIKEGNEQCDDGNTNSGDGCSSTCQIETPQPPSAPSNLQVGSPTISSLTLNWTDNSNNETGFRIYRSDGNNANYLLRSSVGANTNTYADPDLLPATVYYYKVAAYNGVGNSGYSNEANGTTNPSSGVTECNDGIDNDNDGLIDYKYDLGCYGKNDTSESAGTRAQEDGWTTFNPSADTMVVFVSSSDPLRNDSTCKAYTLTELKTLATQNYTNLVPCSTPMGGYWKLRSDPNKVVGYPDWLLLKAGDTWTNTNFVGWTKFGRSATEPMVVSSYGDGPRPKILSGSNEGFSIATVKISNLAIVNLHFKADTWMGLGSKLNGFYYPSYGSNILIEGCLFERYSNSIVFRGYNQNDPNYIGLIDHVSVRRTVSKDPMHKCDQPDISQCQAYGAYGNVHMFIDNTIQSLLLEENLFINTKANDYLTGGGTLLSHGAYIHQSIAPNITTIVRNIIYNARACISDRPGATPDVGIDNNLVIRCGSGITIGEDPSVGGRVVNNVITESRNGWRLVGETMGWAFDLRNINNLELTNNIITHATDGDSNLGIYFWGGIGSTNIHDNIIYDWYRPGYTSYSANASNNNLYGPLTMRNNDFQQPLGGSLLELFSSLNGTYQNNRYYSPLAQAYRYNDSGYTFTQWKSSVEPTAVWQKATYPDPTRSVGLYNQNILGGVNDTEAFLLDAANKQSKQLGWHKEYSAAAVDDYIREGFGK